MGLKEIFSQCPIKRYQNPATTKDAIEALMALDINKQVLTRMLIDQHQEEIDREKAKKRGEKLIGQG